MKITNLEAGVIEQIIEMMKAYNDGNIESNYGVWSNSLFAYGPVKGRELSGACASLVRKGLIFKIKYDEGMCLALTDAGLEMATSMSLVPKKAI